MFSRSYRKSRALKASCLNDGNQIAIGHEALGTSIAVLAVAGIGFAMRQGRLSLRGGVKVVLGRFILFGAPAIANGLAGMARWTSLPAAVVEAAPTPEPVNVPNLPPPNPDPYARASSPRAAHRGHVAEARSWVGVQGDLRNFSFSGRVDSLYLDRSA